MTPARIERILAVDDDPGMRRVLSRTLAPPYQVELARTSAEARERLLGHRFDVALVDIQLEDGDGYRLCREIREKSPETDVILITGSHSEPDEKLYRSLEEGQMLIDEMLAAPRQAGETGPMEVRLDRAKSHAATMRELIDDWEGIAGVDR